MDPWILKDFEKILGYFGGVLGGQDPRFSHFFRCFFEVIVEARSGRAKHSPKRPNKTQMVDLAPGFRWAPASWGKKKRREQEPDRDVELAIGAWPFVAGFSI